MNAPSQSFDTPRRYRLRVEDFLLLDDNGAFAHYTKTELIDGEVFGVNAQHATHARIKSRLHRQIGNRLEAIGSDLESVVEVTVRVAEDSAPEPDIVLTRWRGGGVVPADSVALVIEVAESTLSTDLGRKAELYAAAGVSEYWVVDVEGWRVVTHWRPDADGYRERADVPLGGTLSAATVGGLEIDTAKLLG